MRKFDLSLRSSRSSYFATFRHQLTILSKTDALDEDRKSGSAGMPRPISYAVFCLKKKKITTTKSPTSTKKTSTKKQRRETRPTPTASQWTMDTRTTRHHRVSEQSTRA